jgi:hypothetical protein
MFIADGKDNDCDGVVDEELFDGIDNDLDGKIDEDCYDRKAISQDRCPAVQTAQACYNGQLKLSCETGTISVISAHYGRLGRAGEKTCGSENVMDSCSGADANCGFSDISTTVGIQCQGQSSCSLPVNQFHGWNKCPTCSLYAHVQYVCLNTREQNFGVLSGQNYKASSSLATTVLESSCSKQSAEAGDQHHASKAHHGDSNAVEAWRPAQCDKDSSWLQVDLGSTYAVGWYAISGCRRNDYWTTKFAISHSLDGKTFTVIRNGDGTPKLFDGNADSITAKVCTLFQYNIVARWLRIHPVEYNGSPCAHVDFGHNATFQGCPVTQLANSNFAQGGSTGFGSTATIKCNAGWATAGAETEYTARCQADGKWAGELRACDQLLHCPAIPSIEGGYATGPGNLPGNTIRFQCLGGRRLQGANSATCQPDGTWSNAAPTCEAPQQ